MTSKSWYGRQHATVQAAIVAGALAVVGAIVTGAFALATAKIGSTNNSNSPNGTHKSLSVSMPSGRLQVTISRPADGAILPDNTFGATGTAKHIPANDSLWLVLKPPGYGRWYPVSPISVIGGNWHIPRDIICPASGRQDVEVFLVPDVAMLRLQEYVSSRTAQHDPGIAAMPSLTMLKAVSYVNVRTNKHKGC